jgi:polygalacturonase
MKSELLARWNSVSLNRRQTIQVAAAAVVPSSALLASSLPAIADSAIDPSSSRNAEKAIAENGIGDPVSVKSFGAVGNSNSTGEKGADDTSAIQAALDHIGNMGGGTLYFPKGIYRVSSFLIVPSNVVIKGAGRRASKVVGTHAGGRGQDASERARNGSIFFNARPINTSERIDVTIEDLWLFNSNAANQGAGIYQQSGVVLTVRNCEIGGSKWGIILDQSEDVLIDGCELGSNVAGGAGLWIVNGADLNPRADGGYTNVVSARDCMFNVNPASRGVVDDGGVAHSFQNCNFVSGINGIRASDVVGLTLIGNYFESQVQENIFLASTTLAGTPIGGSTTTIVSGFVTAARGHGAITGSGSPGTLTVIGGQYVGGGGRSPLTNASNFFQIYILGAPGSGANGEFTDGVAGGGGPHVDLAKLTMDRSGNLVLPGLTLTPEQSATPTAKGQMTFEVTNDTTLKIKVRGKDGRIRSATLPLT